MPQSPQFHLNPILALLHSLLSFIYRIISYHPTPPVLDITQQLPKFNAYFHDESFIKVRTSLLPRLVTQITQMPQFHSTHKLRAHNSFSLPPQAGSHVYFDCEP